MPMNESEWFSCANPEPMLQLVRHALPESELRLFVCGCCRRIWHLLVDQRSRSAVESAEAFARGEIGERELQVAKESAYAAYCERSQNAYDHAAGAAFFCTNAKKTMLPAAANLVLAAVENKDEERAAQADLLRDIVGNPFQIGDP